MQTRTTNPHHRARAAFLAGLAGLILMTGPARAQNSAGADEAPAATPARVEMGQPAPDFDLEASDGTRHSLSELRDKKNLVLVFFRGTW